ncbi:hypothetical protein [Azonexus sp.]|uniref:hypothetical protein n=1 Tax=Azonexus sp. TaxID=1872668 RepID=UPI0027BADA0B|nr:hypothetical protein [Azonexus sp.]
MSAQIHALFHPGYAPEHLSPSLAQPVGGPINGQREKDHRCDFERLQKDQRTAWAFAQRHHLAVLTVAADRNGAYLVVAPAQRLLSIFDDECACWRSEPSNNGMKIEHWVGLANGNIRVFWRDVKCAH